jgi:hypothetical protein
MTPLALKRKTRSCALPGCPETLGSGYRSHAKYCSAACRAKAARKRPRDKALSARRTKRTEASSSRTRKRTESPTAPRAASEAPLRPVVIDAEVDKPFVVPRMTQAKSERRRPDWHAWVYGAAGNPIHGKRGRP